MDIRFNRSNAGGKNKFLLHFFVLQFFYYSNGRAYPGKDVQFKDRISWAGDLNKKDASISIADMRFQDNGTYVCDVKNPPDIVVTPGEIKLRVVEKGIRVSR